MVVSVVFMAYQLLKGRRRNSFADKKYNVVQKSSNEIKKAKVVTLKKNGQSAGKK